MSNISQKRLRDERVAAQSPTLVLSAVQKIDRVPLVARISMRGAGAAMCAAVLCGAVSAPGQEITGAPAAPVAPVSAVAPAAPVKVQLPADQRAFKAAQGTVDPEQRLALLRQFVKDYPKSKRVSTAQFGILDVLGKELP